MSNVFERKSHNFPIRKLSELKISFSCVGAQELMLKSARFV